MSRSLNVATRVLNTQRTAQAQALNGSRGLHVSLRRQAILMPAMSPLMREGTIKTWKKKEGESFVPGDVLLQIESDIAMIDVEAQSPGILGKILLPDGSTNVPVEQIIALVARDSQELAALQSQTQSLPTPTPPRLNPIPSPPSSSLNPTSRDSTSAQSQSQRLRPRTPSLYEMQTMKRSTPHTATFATSSTSSPSQGSQSTGVLSAGFKLQQVRRSDVYESQQGDVVLRRKIVVNFNGKPPRSPVTSDEY